LSALVIATYSGSPAPTSSCVTQMLGWVLLNSVTARPMPGTQAQKVIFTAFGLQDPPATTLTLGLALAVVPVLVLAAVLGVVDEPLLLQAASSDNAPAPAITGNRVLITA
jgi:hypothetical protein